MSARTILLHETMTVLQEPAQLVTTAPPCLCISLARKILREGAACNLLDLDWPQHSGLSCCFLENLPRRCQAGFAKHDTTYTKILQLLILRLGLKVELVQRHFPRIDGIEYLTVCDTVGTIFNLHANQQLTS